MWLNQTLKNFWGKMSLFVPNKPQFNYVTGGATHDTGVSMTAYGVY